MTGKERDATAVCPECHDPDPVLCLGDWAGFELVCGNEWHRTCAFPGGHAMKIGREGEEAPDAV